MAKTYCIKDGYQHGTANVTVEQTPGEYWSPQRFKATRHNQLHTYLEARDLLRERGLKTVLDVGCGVGYKLATVLSPLAARAVGVDQPNAIKLARQFYAHLPIQFEAVDLEEKRDSGLGTFDLVVCADVIEHLLDPDVLLEFILAHCHERSCVVISTPERDVRRGPGNVKSPRREHVREWNRDELRRYLEASGLRVVRQLLRPGFAIGWSPKYLRERLRLLRQRVPYRYCQVAVCEPGRARTASC